MPDRVRGGPVCAVVRAGADLGLRHAGAFAFDAARLERGFRSWGHDIGPLDDPFAAGLGFAVSRRKALDFVGREALERSARRRARAAARQRPCPRRRAVARRVAAARRRASRATSRAPPSRRRWAARRGWAGSRAARRRVAGRDRRRARPVPGQPRAVLRPARGAPAADGGTCARVSCGRGPSSRCGRRRPRRRRWSGGRPCGRSGRRRRSGCGRAGRRGPRAGRRRRRGRP